MKLKYIIGSFILALTLSSCVVSKKKYDTLSRAKFASDRKVRTLLREKGKLQRTLEENQQRVLSLKNNLRSLKEEFNNLKYDMSASNAKKSSEIDKLSKKLNNTLKDKESFSEKTQELKDNLDWLRKKRQENTATIDSLSTKCKALESQVRRLEAAKNATKNTNSEYHQKILNLKSKVNALNELLKREKATNQRLQKALQSKPKTTK